MSKLIVEVCRVAEIKDHPGADRLKIACIKDWETVIKYDPETGRSQFNVGDLCVYFPPDSVLPESIINGSEDNPPGRLGIKNYLKELPADEEGNRPTGRRVAATRLRGIPSYGVIMNIDPAWGDDPNWVEGTDVAEHFGVTKYEPQVSDEGDADKECWRFYQYTNIENQRNYPDAFADGDEVIFTEKIHGRNCRIGLVLDTNEIGVEEWTLMAGSNNHRRKEYGEIQKRFKLEDIGKIGENLKLNEIFLHADCNWWQVLEFVPIRTEEDLPKVLVRKMKQNEETGDFEVVLVRSDYWEPLTPNVCSLLENLKEMDWHEPKHAIILYGELFGPGCQDMSYGQKARSFRLFDISINNRYLDFDMKVKLASEYAIPMVPILYRGPFNKEAVALYTDGPTTLCKPEEAGKFKGREGVVITPVKEVHFCPILRSRRILKSVSADYLARKGGTEYH